MVTVIAFSPSRCGWASAYHRRQGQRLR